MSTSAVTRQDTPADSNENRRRSERRPYVIEAFLSSPTAVEPVQRIEATAVNLSRHGIAFDIEQPLPTGCFYTIEVGMGDQRLVAEVRIVSCRQTDENIYAIGASFS